MQISEFMKKRRFKNLQIKEGTVNGLWGWAVVDVRSPKRRVFVKDFSTKKECEQFINLLS